MIMPYIDDIHVLMHADDSLHGRFIFDGVFETEKQAKEYVKPHNIPEYRDIWWLCIKTKINSWTGREIAFSGIAGSEEHTGGRKMINVILGMILVGMVILFFCITAVYHGVKELKAGQALLALYITKEKPPRLFIGKKTKLHDITKGKKE